MFFFLFLKLLYHFNYSGRKTCAWPNFQCLQFSHLSQFFFLFFALNWNLQLELLNTWSRLIRHWTLQYVSIFWKVLFRCVILPIRKWLVHFIWSYIKSDNGGKWDKIFVIDCPFDSRKEEHSRNNKSLYALNRHGVVFKA